MSYPFETQPSKAELCRGLAQYSPALAAEARQAAGDAIIQRSLELPWWCRALRFAVRNFDRRIALIAHGGFTLCSLLAFWDASMIVAAIYFAVLYAMIRLDQIRDNKPVYITPMDDEEESGEVQS